MLSESGLLLGNDGKVCKGYYNQGQFKRMGCEYCPRWMRKSYEDYNEEHYL